MNKITFSKNIFSRYFDRLDHAVYYDRKMDRFYLLKGVAAVVSKQLMQCKNFDIEKIRQVIFEKFDCANHSVEKDIFSVIQFLEQNNIIDLPSEKTHATQATKKSQNKQENLQTVDSIENEIFSIASDNLIPFHATLEITSHCPLKCIHCFMPKPVESRWTHESFEKTLLQLKKLGAMELTITGGECLSHPQIYDFLTLAEEHEFIVNVLTNGLFINSHTAQLLAARRPRMVQLSLYAADASTHDAITQVPGSFEKTTQAIQYLQETGIKPKVACSVMNTNYDKIDALFTWCQKQGIPCSFDFKIFPSYDTDRKTQNIACFHQPSLQQVMSQKRFNVLLQNPNESHSKPNPKRKLCTAGHKSLTVTSDGYVLPCNLLRLKVGNVFEKSLEEIWYHSPLLKKWRAISVSDYPKCANCEAFEHCQACLAGCFIEKGNFKEVDEQTCFFGKLNHSLIQDSKLIHKT
ncbi:MAG: radical SAM protein [Gammaproteobacteria bacterium]|nr:radical SAM protein [Gammaproteobacteria bacterium]MBU1926709.1 radical SAM protein [Gammaproteobacteria bacterium]MBU2546169.1 radical SAM protein [Gammaproteobacteria bacterium]